MHHMQFTMSTSVKTVHTLYEMFFRAPIKRVEHCNNVARGSLDLKIMCIHKSCNNESLLPYQLLGGHNIISYTQHFSLPEETSCNIDINYFRNL